MNLKTWLKTVRGRAKALAEHTGASRGAITQWSDSKTGIPVSRHQQIYNFTRGEVGYLDMISEAELNELIRINPLIAQEITRRAYAAATA
jgi:DNA-binding transcriptional regulator YdaS (Cro superfamily)